jgi:tyrosinase
MVTRKNQKALTAQEWSDFVDAINQTHGVSASAPAYRVFVKVHERAMNPTDMQGMSWGVHTMGPMMRGRNFLSWHRQFVLRMELRLQKVHAGVTIPYWDAVKDRSIPAALANPALLASWGVTRQWNPSLLPQPADVTALNGFSTFTAFQSAIEGAVHGGVHNAVGGDMATAASPSDPLFWLHHANIDRLWSKWQKQHASAHPPNMSETLRPQPLFGVKVVTVQSITKLGYRYA